MDKRDMDRALSEAAELAALISPELLARRANLQYQQIMEGLGDLIVALTLNAYVGDNQRLEATKIALKDNLSRLDALCDRFNVENKHESLCNHLDKKVTTKEVE